MLRLKLMVKVVIETKFIQGRALLAIYIETKETTIETDINVT